MKLRTLLLAAALLMACRADDPVQTPPPGEPAAPPPKAETPLPDFTVAIEEPVMLLERAGTPVQVFGTIANTGTAPAEVAVKWSIGGVEVAYGESEYLRQGQERDVSAWVIVPELATGPYELTLEADPANEVEELDESNNAATAEDFIHILHGVDHEAVILSVTTATERAGEPLHLRVRWRNDGSLPAAAATARVYLVGPVPEPAVDYVHDVTVPALAPKSQTEATYLVRPLRGGGDYFLEVSIPQVATEVEPADNAATSPTWFRLTSRLQLVWSAQVTDTTTAPAWSTPPTGGAMKFFYGTGRRGLWGRVSAVTATTGELVWSRDVSDAVNGVPAYGDAEGDGSFEVYAGVRNGVYALRATDGALLWKRAYGYSIATPVLLDMVPSNGTLELVITGGIPPGGLMSILRADTGAELYTYAQPTTAVIFYPGRYGGVAVGDVDGDGRGDVAVGTLSFNPDADVSVFAAAGTTYARLWSKPAGSQGFFVAPTMTDVTGDGKSDVVVGDMAGNLRAYRGDDGTLLWTRTQPGKVVGVPVSAGDLAAGGAPEIAFFWSENTTSTDQAGILTAASASTGTPLWSLPFEGQPIGGPALADLDGDGRDEVVAAVDTPRNTCMVLVVSPDGAVIDAAEDDGRCYNSVSVVDTDGDGDYELQVGSLRLFSTPYLVTTPASWPKQGKAAGNSSHY